LECIDDFDGLLGLIEMDVVEVHPWGATVEDIKRPDVLVFDLDPGEGISWDFVVETAFRLGDMLAEDGLEIDGREGTSL
jgi:bifunctional non-homologous end joining protein LigD